MEKNDLSTDATELIPKISVSTLASFITDPFPVSSSAEIGSLALLADQKLSDILKLSFGGIFDIHHFKIKPGMAGVRLWYCLNTDDPRLPKFFLALEQIAKFNESNPEEVTKPIESLYVIPEVFPFKGNIYSKVEVEKFMINEPSLVTPENNRVIDQNTMLKYARNFKILMSDIYNRTGLLYCKYAVAFFEFNSAYNDFMWNTEMIKVKYFVGLAVDTVHKPNYLRPVLAGVHLSGSTISQRSLAANGPFLQKSVPPPPDN